MPEVILAALWGAIVHLVFGVLLNYVSIYWFDYYDYKFGPDGTFDLANIVTAVLSGFFFVAILVLGGIIQWTTGAFSRASPFALICYPGVIAILFAIALRAAG